MPSANRNRAFARASASSLPVFRGLADLVPHQFSQSAPRSLLSIPAGSRKDPAGGIAYTSRRLARLRLRTLLRRFGLRGTRGAEETFDLVFQVLLVLIVFVLSDFRYERIDDVIGSSSVKVLCILFENYLRGLCLCSCWRKSSSTLLTRLLHYNRTLEGGITFGAGAGARALLGGLGHSIGHFEAALNFFSFTIVFVT